ncbi:MAG TPA: YiiD C-terminal domain-containing protein [Candidatus Limnocylindria bacterium]|nr:YiiD C-terminal domain-containing protein [Candidatus Limnocylindria bacterium]
MDSGDEVERYLHEHIPISRALGVTVVRADVGGVELRAPLTPNINHRSTVFGGSAISVAILAAWTLVHLWTLGLARLGRYRVVIRRSAMDYTSPVQGDFSAICTAPGDALDRFTRTLERHRRARVDLTARVTSGDQDLGSFAGSYVAIRLDEGETR